MARGQGLAARLRHRHALAGVVFTARFVVQQWLYDGDHTGWLAFARIAMGYPLYGLAGLVVLWAVRRSDRRLKVLAEQRSVQQRSTEGA
ncbi:DUF3159 domain-containing protein [Streptomyces sp. M19]